ncbi:MAG: hypothetical protein COZ56_18125 [Armatimonadetes bacterium CG_4_8_14_3_um_filter_58_9]|nr:MAG: hypothetical protein COZ56_18125 [Armatimonadetes bacterium CG_4_8_14_3_um_filter_58_9]PJB77948.1 MAG: hypothetical protein CO095_01025 [Armatimonadetes bacterium CG_4_9_14_3_um_filter_58_7]
MEDCGAMVPAAFCASNCHVFFVYVDVARWGCVMPVLLGVIAGLLIFNASITPEDLARQVEKGLRQRVGKVDELHVALKGPKGYKLRKGNLRKADVFIKGFDADRLSLGGLVSHAGVGVGAGTAVSATAKVSRVKELTVQCEDFVYDGANIQQLRLYLYKVRYDRDAAQKRSQFRLLGIEKGVAEVHVPKSFIQGRVVEMLSDLEGVTAQLGTDKVTVSGKKRVLLIAVPFEVEGTLRPKGNTVHLVNPRLKVTGVGLPAGFTDWVLKKVNPVYVFDQKEELPFSVNITAITVSPDGLAVRAHVSLRE